MADPDYKTKEKILRDLVAPLQDVAKNIPTEEPSPSVTVDTMWKKLKLKLKSKNGGVPTVVSQTPSLTNEIITAFWKPRSDASKSVILPSDTTAIEKTTPEDHQSETSASVVYTDFPALQKQLPSDTTTAVKTKSFDQLTNGALSILVEYLKNVKKSCEMLHRSMNKPVGADVLDMICYSKPSRKHCLW
ncbi:hypothetical protein JRQ81_006797 [Phrynocephalus forsythii]|uniref:Uncharacterized protein n=1 Tax=Phrynocephalus forsythii TaxID=171643 RepID=A0A9Q0XFP0_9SAUR|nr:hypothetical protein JRQ81_006797 [Phrynocephalus forsythii]